MATGSNDKQHNIYVQNADPHTTSVNGADVETFLIRVTDRFGTRPLLYDQSLNTQLSDPPVQVRHLSDDRHNQYLPNLTNVRVERHRAGVPDPYSRTPRSLWLAISGVAARGIYYMKRNRNPNGA